MHMHRARVALFPLRKKEPGKEAILCIANGSPDKECFLSTVDALPLLPC